MIMSRRKNKDAKSDLLIGIAHDRIMFLGTIYLKRGYVTTDEYENLRDYLYTPYKQAGGNGSAEHIMQQVDKLPIVTGDTLSFSDEAMHDPSFGTLIHSKEVAINK